MERFKKDNKFEKRKTDTKNVMTKYPSKIPVYLSRGRMNRTMEEYDKRKFLVGDNMKLISFLNIVRKNYGIESSKSLYLMINDKVLVDNVSSMGIIYDKYKDEDGYLYISYYEENVFGI